MPLNLSWCPGAGYKATGSTRRSKIIRVRGVDMDFADAHLQAIKTIYYEDLKETPRGISYHRFQ